jgi:hypothetical protein
VLALGEVGVSERWVTATLLLIIGVVIITDITFWNYGTGTYSDVIRRSLRAHPLIPFLFGLIVGHLVWP